MGSVHIVPPKDVKNYCEDINDDERQCIGYAILRVGDERVGVVFVRSFDDWGECCDENCIEMSRFTWDYTVCQLSDDRLCNIEIPELLLFKMMCPMSFADEPYPESVEAAVVLIPVWL